MHLIRKIHWFLYSQMGINLLIFVRSLGSFYRYFKDYLSFSNLYKGQIRLTPCLHDRRAQGSGNLGEYFWQDLKVAQMIFDQKPIKHVDIGSRVDGFVANVASFREIEIFDIREIVYTIEGVTYRKADLMDSKAVSHFYDYAESVSCLHALEHFGLGRYGDAIDIEGYKLGLENISKIIKKDGFLYLSVPCGQPRVEFNANWVFDPNEIIELLNAAGFALETFFQINPEIGPVKTDVNLIASISSVNYVLCLFVARKLI